MQRTHNPPEASTGSRYWPISAIVLIVCVQAAMVYTRAINWDEFFHYSQIARHARGEAVTLLQSPFIPLFGWVTDLPGLSTDHIRVTRWLMLPFELVTLAAVYGCARQLVPQPAALVTTLAYAAGGYVMTQMLVLRADPIATALLMASLWLCFRRGTNAWQVVLAAILFAIAMACTIKSIFYAFPILGALIYRRDRFARWQQVAAICALSLGAAVGAATLLLPIDRIMPGSTLAQVHLLAINSWHRMFSAGLFPNGQYLVSQIGRALFLPIMLGIGVAMIWRRAGSMADRIGLCLFLIPLLSVIVYRNAYPYFYVFAFAPAMAVIAPGAAFLIQRYGMRLVTLVIMGNAAVLVLTDDRATARAQDDTVAAAHEIFDRPVVYFDNHGLIGDFPRGVSQFASGWALSGYRDRGNPIYAQAMARQTVPMLLPSAALTNAVSGITEPPDEVLLPEDAEAIRENYIQHWGVIFVAGKVVPASTKLGDIRIAVPGPYTVEGAPLVVDGRKLAVGDVIELQRGVYTVEPDARTGSTLRWGNHLPVPDRAPPTAPVINGY